MQKEKMKQLIILAIVLFLGKTMLPHFSNFNYKLWNYVGDAVNFFRANPLATLVALGLIIYYKKNH
ncbi:MAG: hypothetical protein P9L98_01605 [Candidatus Kaelpia imicola]|nr:hypothetical protein [Candidatus Kaelpia imicola]